MVGWAGNLIIMLVPSESVHVWCVLKEKLQSVCNLFPDLSIIDESWLVVGSGLWVCRVFCSAPPRVVQTLRTFVPPHPCLFITVRCDRAIEYCMLHDVERGREEANSGSVC